MSLRPLRAQQFAHSPVLRRLLVTTSAVIAIGNAVACSGDQTERRNSDVRNTIASAITGKPDVLPTMVNREPPFRYPAGLYGRRVQGNVTLRLFVDSMGTVVTDSTRVEEGSGHSELDSAAVTGSRDLRFNPARRRGDAIAVSLLYPVYFRHPEAAPLPGDTILQ